MNHERQEWFYRKFFSPERYQRLYQLLEKRLGTAIHFRIFEAPVFLSSHLRHAIANTCIELVKQCTTPEYLRHALVNAIPEKYRMHGVSECLYPGCVVIDFAITDINGVYTPKLIELQGFPSLFAYQYFLAHAYHEAYELTEDFSPFFDTTLTMEEYRSILTSWLVGSHHPDNTALVDYYPHEQKTYPDFAATRIMTGMAASDITELRYIHGHLFHERGGAWHPLRRIYMRAITDELEQNAVILPFHWSDLLNVEWVVHPNWYFLISKYSLPFLNHETVPKAMFCDSVTTIPPSGSFVLKPLFAFAGKGVLVDPTNEDLANIPSEERSQWLLMEKVEYARCLPTPEGNNAIEVRCMVLWMEGKEPLPTISLVRTGRGKLMGSRYLSEPWTGASICFFERE